MYAFALHLHRVVTIERNTRGRKGTREREERESLGITTTLYYYYYEHNGRRSPEPTDSMIDWLID